MISKRTGKGKQIINNWWISLFLGTLFFIMAILLIFGIIHDIRKFEIIFCITLLISGILEVVFSLSNRKTLTIWRWCLTGAILELMLAFFMSYFNYPIEYFVYFFVIWLLIRGFSAFGYAFDFNRLDKKKWIWILILGILAVFCAAILILQSMQETHLNLFIIATGFLCMSLFRFLLGIELRRLNKIEQII